MPGMTVGTILSQARKTGNSPAPNVWHATANTGAHPSKPPTMPHGLTPWVGAHPQSTMATYPARIK